MTPKRPNRETRTVVDRLARLGLGARGLVYLLIAWTAVRIATGSGGGEADRSGAMKTFTRNGAGKAVLFAMMLGFAGYAAWRATEVIWGHRDDDGWKRWAKRGGSACRGGLYAVFAFEAGRAVFAGNGGQGSNSTSKKATAGLLAHSGGRTAVIVLGIGFAIAGVVLAVRGVLRKFEKNLKTAQMGEKTEDAIGALGLFGQTARGVVFAIVGGFFIDAAAKYDPGKAQGLDGALRALAKAPIGGVLLGAVALGLASFGAYSLAEARYRET